MTDLKKARLKLGLTQYHAALLCKVSINTYIKWEKGVNKPNLENKKKLIEVLKINKEEI